MPRFQSFVRTASPGHHVTVFPHPGLLDATSGKQGYFGRTGITVIRSRYFNQRDIRFDWEIPPFGRDDNQTVIRGPVEG
jgi:hypothetical protein